MSARPEEVFSELHTASVVLVAMPDNQHALSGSRDNTIKLFNVNDGAVLRTFKHLHTAQRPGAAARRPPLRQRERRIAYHGLAPLAITSDQV